MLDKNKTVLVVTGCIAPPQGVAELAVADAEARRQQYLDSLGWALHETPFTKIVYCDNSDASAPAELLAHAQATGKKLEWLHFAGDAAPRAKATARAKFLPTRWRTVRCWPTPRCSAS